MGLVGKALHEMVGVTDAEDRPAGTAKDWNQPVVGAAPPAQPPSASIESDGGRKQDGWGGDAQRVDRGARRLEGLPGARGHEGTDCARPPSERAEQEGGDPACGFWLGGMQCSRCTSKACAAQPEPSFTPSEPPGWFTAKSSTPKPLRSMSSQTTALTITSCPTTLLVGAPPTGSGAEPANHRYQIHLESR